MTYKEVADGGALVGVKRVEAGFDVEQDVADAVLAAGAREPTEDAGQQIAERLVSEE